MQRLTAEHAVIGLDPGAPDALRRRVPCGDAARRDLLGALAGAAPERLVLHTCERLELHVVVPPGAATDEAARRLAGWLGVGGGELSGWLVRRAKREAERHLLRVAAGLESRLPGEPQIQGQLRRAVAEAGGAGALGPRLGGLARAALRTGRRVRSETPLGRTPSLVDLALARLRAATGGLKGQRVLLAGTGALARDLAADLAREGAHVVVASRDPERAADLAREHGGSALPLQRLASECARSGAPLVACTDAPVVLRERLRRPGLVLDLGSPPSVRAVAGIEVTRLEALRADGPPPPLEAATRIVEEELDRYRTDREQRAAASRVADLVRRRSRTWGRPTPAERRALHLEILRLKASAAA